MGKPLVHLIPSQEALLRNEFNTSSTPKTTNNESEKEGSIKRPTPIPSSRNSSHAGVNRSSTHSSQGSSKTVSSGESDLSSFVHSNASLSSFTPSTVSRADADADPKEQEKSIGHKNTSLDLKLAPSPDKVNKISRYSSSIGKSKVNIAVQNFEEIIEITRQKSIEAERRKPLWKTRKPKNYDVKKKEKLAHTPARYETPVKASVSATPSVKPRRVRQQSSPVDRSSSSFFWAVDKHVECRSSNTRNRRAKQLTLANNSIEVLKSVGGKVQHDEILFPDDTKSMQIEEASDTGSVLSPSRTARQRKPHSKKPPSTFVSQAIKNTLKTKVPSKIESNIAVNETEVCRKQEIQRNVSNPYKFARMEEHVAIEVGLRIQRKPKAPKSKRIFNLKGKRNKAARTVLNPIETTSIQVIEEEVEVLRSNNSTKIKGVKSTKTFSYDETEEDLIVQKIVGVATPPQTPPAMERLHIVKEGDQVENFPSTKASSLVPKSLVSLPSSKEGEENVELDKTTKTTTLAESNTVQESAASLSVDETMTIEVEASPALVNKTLTEIPAVEASRSIEEESVSLIEKKETASKSIAEVDTFESQPMTTSGPESDAMKPPAITHTKEESDDSSQSDKPSQQEISIVVPKLPAPKNDTTSFHEFISLIDENPKTVQDGSGKSEGSTQDLTPSASNFSLQESIRPVNIHVENIKDIEVSSLASTGVQKEDNVSTTNSKKSLKSIKYTSMEVKPMNPAIKSTPEISPKQLVPKTKHVVHFNVLGVAGIVVDRASCIDVTGDKNSPLPPEQMVALVGVSEAGSKSMDNVTTFSSALIHAPNTKASTGGESTSTKQNQWQRHIAVWASNHRGDAPGSIVESNIIDTEVRDRHDPKSKFKSKRLNLNVAIAKIGHDENHVAVVIGTAEIDITDRMIRRGEDRTVDLPVRQIENHIESRTGSVIRVRSLNRRKGIKKLFLKKPERDDAIRHKEVSSVYTIDPEGDAMIRVQVSVEEILTSMEQEKVSRLESFANRTAATVETDDSSFANSVYRTSSTCRAFNDFCPPKANESPDRNSLDIYSTPVDLPTDFSSHGPECSATSWKSELRHSKSDEDFDGYGCSLFGKNVSFPTRASRKAVVKHIDDKIDGIAERFLATQCDARRKSDSDSFIGLEASTVLGNETAFTDGTGTYIEDDSITNPGLLTGMNSVIGPVPSIHELRGLAKELALTSGEFFFPDDPMMTGNESTCETISVGSATLDAFKNDKLGMRSMESRDSWTKVDGDEDRTTSSKSGSYGCENASPKKSFAQGKVLQNKFDRDDDAPIIDDEICNGSISDPIDEKDEEESNIDSRPPLIDKDIKLEDETSLQKQDGTKADDKPSLSSVVENIAEVLSIGGKACGYFGTEGLPKINSPTALWTARKSIDEIPNTIDHSDVESVGELTAITLEKNEIRDENRKLLMSRLGLSTNIFARGNKQDITPSEIYNGTQANIAGNGSTKHLKTENYFAEYEDGANGVSSIYSTGAISMKRFTPSRSNKENNLGSEMDSNRQNYDEKSV